MICLFSFPRSGSTWVLEVLNTLDGINLCNEPVYGLRGHRITRWLENRHPTFYEGRGAYRGDYMQPTPSPNMQKNVPVLFADLAAHNWGHNGWKEVYLCHKIPLVLEGIRAAREAGMVAAKHPPKIIHLWRSFPGVAASFQKRDICSWVVQTFEAQREGSKGTPVEPIYHLLEPKDDLEKLFIIWLAATYRDKIDVEEAGGISVCYDALTQPDAGSWSILSAAIGQEFGPPGAFSETHIRTPEMVRIRKDMLFFQVDNRKTLTELEMQAMSVEGLGRVGQLISRTGDCGG